MGFEEFAKFYRPLLNFTEEDFFKLLSTLRLPLPSALRVTNTVFADLVHAKLKFKKSKYFVDVYEADRKKISNRGFIVNQTRAGHIQRQEVVSMLPVLLMNVTDSMDVLDMCAAPGSKTKQILQFTKGLVVCNDFSPKRMRILVSETCKIPSKNFMVLRHDASALPVFKTDFDRVLCDVPCSGDGTSRKNYDVVPNWSISHALSLCELQYNILKNALNFTKDGLVIYSTCSLNPIENECIVQKAVKELDLEIVDLRENVNEKYMSKKFRLRNGLESWDMEVKKQGDIDLTSGEEDIGLSKCIRVYPHDQNTGGFFITGLRKKNSSKIYTDLNTSEVKSEDKIEEDIKLNDIENKINDIKLDEVKIEEVKPAWFEVEGELRDLLDKEYNCKDKILIKKHANDPYIYEVSQEVLNIMKTNKLNVNFHGYKLFEKNEINESGYSIRTVVGEVEHDLELEGDLMNQAIINKEIIHPYSKGSIMVLLKDFKTVVSAYSHGEKITFNIGDRLQRAMKDFIKK